MNDELLYKYISGQAEPEERQVVTNWALESENRKKEIHRLRNIWILAGLDQEIDPEIKAQEIDRIWSIIRKMDINSKQVSLRLNFLKYAALFILVIGLSGTIGFFISTWTPKSESQYTEIIVPKGERSSVVLPDGSTVQLNSDSKLRFSSSFNSGKRKVILSGEAFFNVSHDKSHPFLVETSSLQIEVLGTRFNISSYPNDKLTTTFLESGKVKITGVGSDNVILSPNEAFVFNKSSRESHKLVISDKRLMNWTRGVLTINDETIGELAKKIERRYNVEIKFKDDEVKNHTYTGSINDQDLNTVLEALKFASSIKYHREGNKIFLSSAE